MQGGSTQKRGANKPRRMGSTTVTGGVRLAASLPLSPNERVDNIGGGGVKRRWFFLMVCAALVCSTQAFAADYKCRSGSVSKSGSTKYRYKESSSEVVVTKSGSTRGKARKSGSKWTVTVSGSSKARFDDRTIYRSGSSWAKVSEAQQQFDCPPHVAATLWVLMRVGQL